MIITIGGRPGSGKSSVAKKLAQRLGLRYYSVGDLMGSLAREHGMTLLEFSRLAERDGKIDKLLDEAQVKLARNDDFVIDSRLGFHFIPSSIKIFLDVDEKVGAERILSSVKKKERPDEEENRTLRDAVENTRRRVDSERKRYMKYYNVDPYDVSNYDFLIDTTDFSVDEVVEFIVSYLKKEGFL